MATKPSPAHEALQQIWVGRDFPPPASVLRGVNPTNATILPAGFKYSLITVVEHTDFWQRIWLARLHGQKVPTMFRDWRVPPSSEWTAIRASFLANFEEAIRIASGAIQAATTQDVTSTKLFQIAVHNAYHIGQMVLIKRAVREALKGEHG